MNKLTLITTLFFMILTAFNANPAPVTLQSNWESNRYGIGVLTFTYEDQTPYTYPQPWRSQYDNAITELNFVFDAVSYTLDKSQPNNISLVVKMESGANIALQGLLIDANGEQYNMYLGLEIYSLSTSGENSLSTLIGAMANENATYLGKPGDSVFVATTSLLTMRSPFTAIAEVPTPTAAWLFGTGMIGLLGAIQRQRFRNKA